MTRLENAQQIIDNASIYSPDYGEDVKGTDFFYCLWNEPDLRENTTEFDGVPFRYLFSVFELVDADSGETKGQYVFLLDGYLYAVDFRRDSWNGTEIDKEIYPIQLIHINITKDKTSRRCVRVVEPVKYLKDL